MENAKDPRNKKTILGKVFARLLGLVLVLSLLPAVFPVSPVSAGMQSCRGDPKFYLSNGAVVTATTTIYTAASNVVSATFVLHAPKGLSLTKVVYPSKGTITELSSVVFDQAAGVYWVDVYVSSKVSGVSVTATGQVNSGTVKTVSGLTGQHLKITLP